MTLKNLLKNERIKKSWVQKMSYTPVINEKQMICIHCHKDIIIRKLFFVFVGPIGPTLYIVFEKRKKYGLLCRFSKSEKS